MENAVTRSWDAFQANVSSNHCNGKFPDAVKPDWHHIGAILSKIDKDEFYKNKLSDLYVGTLDDSQIGPDVSSTFEDVVK
jgi:hypothetical protein